MSLLVRLAAAAVAAAGLVLCAGWTLRLGYADWLARRETREGLEAAVRLAPAEAAYHFRLAAAPGADRLAELHRTLERNPLHAAAWIELGLELEVRGELTRAEGCLLEAARIDRTYEPRWTLANFYFRRGNAERFWPWARAACEMAYNDPTVLFRLSWRLTGDAATILDKAMPDRPRLLARYLSFLLYEGRLEAAQAVAERLLPRAGPQTAEVLLGACDRLLDAGRVEPARRIWNHLARARLIPADALEAGGGPVIANGDFRRPLLDLGFGWRLPRAPGLTVAFDAGERALRLSLSGQQPEFSDLLVQTLPVTPGRRHRLEFEYRIEGAPAPTGIRWRVLEAASTPLESDQWTSASFEFTPPEQARVVRLALACRREPASVRWHGALWLRAVRLIL